MANLNRGHTFWKEIDNLTETLRKRTRIENIVGVFDKGRNYCKPTSRIDVIEKIECFVEGLMSKLAQGSFPDIPVKNRSSWANVTFNDTRVGMSKCASEVYVKLSSSYSVQKYAIILKILSIAHKLLKEDAYATKRDIYYNDVPFFGNQRFVDNAVDDISCMLNIPRYSLHILACSKGYVSGDLTYKEHSGNFIDCSLQTNGMLVPTHVHGIYDICSEAKAIIVIEKDATYQSLLDEKILEKLKPIILITGKGFPDLNTRLFVKKLSDSLEIPVLAMVDADPHGIEIMCVYRFGSKSQSYDVNNLTVPSIKWIGVLPSDLEKLSIDKKALIPLSSHDQKKISHLLERPYVKTHVEIQQELLIMLNSGVKAEMQAISSMTAGFLTNVYLPVKIKHGKWI